MLGSRSSNMSSHRRLSATVSTVTGIGRVGVDILVAGVAFGALLRRCMSTALTVLGTGRVGVEILQTCRVVRVVSSIVFLSCLLVDAAQRPSGPAQRAASMAKQEDFADVFEDFVRSGKEAEAAIAAWLCERAPHFMRSMGGMLVEAGLL